MKSLVAGLVAATCTFALVQASSAETARKPTRVELTVTAKGFEPDKIKVAVGEPLTLVFTRKTDKTCAKNVVVQLGDGKTIKKDLPLDKPVEISATFTKSGELRYACSMDMISGVIAVQ
ncbi:MAG: cupredoxin domain-containing protein [Kofleriaceae bacterium]